MEGATPGVTMKVYVSMSPGNGKTFEELGAEYIKQHSTKDNRAEWSFI